MRFKAFLLLCGLLIPSSSSPASASQVFGLSANQNYLISGPWQDDIPVNIDLIGWGGFFPSGHEQSGYDIRLSVYNDFWSINLETCGHRYCLIAPPHGYLLANADHSTFHVSPITASSWVYDAGSGYFRFPSEAYVSLVATVPDGFSITAVPEPSTWAMMLIGFAGLGFAASAKQLLARRAFGIKAQ